MARQQGTLGFAPLFLAGDVLPHWPGLVRSARLVIAAAGLAGQDLPAGRRHRGRRTQFNGLFPAILAIPGSVGSGNTEKERCRDSPIGTYIVILAHQVVTRI
ncbi:hypothetical protein D3C72_1441490 [compost metagenome]